MRYQISGRQLDIGEALQTHVKSELNETIEKYNLRPTEAVVVFSRNAHELVCEATLRLSTGLTAQARGVSGEFYPAFENCRERLDKQLRRHKRRIRDHSEARNSRPVEFLEGSTYILASNDEPEDSEDATLQPMIIAEMEARVPAVSVGEAVLHLDLSGQKFLLFRNEGHGGVNLVYRRDDGNIGWIDPRNSK